MELGKMARRNLGTTVLVLAAALASQVWAQAAAPAPRVRKLTIGPPSAAAATSLRAFQQKLRGAQVLWDRDTQLPARVSGLGLKVAPAASAGNIDPVARQFMRANQSFLGTDPSDLNPRMVLERRGRVLVKYQQMHKGVPVEGAEVGCMVAADGRLMQYASNYAPLGRFSTDAKFPRDGVVQLVRRALGRFGPGAAINAIDKVIRRERAKGSIRHRLVYRVHATTTATDRQQYVTLVFDANTGHIISMGDRFPTTITGTVRGEIHLTRASDAPTLTPLNHLAVTAGRAGSTSVQLIPTRSDGHYTLPAGAGTWQVRAALSGLSASVTSQTQTDVAHADSVANGATHNWDWTNANGDDLEQLNVFYHINRLHDELYVNLLDYRWTNDWTGTQQFIAETGRAWDNAHAGSPMVFGAGDWSLGAEVVYHECTHNVLHSIFGGDYVGYVSGDDTANHHEAYAFDEGFSDFFGCALLGWSTHGGRNLRNAMQYPAEYDVETGQGLEGHSGGQVIAGAAWDLRLLMQQRLGESEGANACTQLVFDSLATLATFPRPYRFSYPDTSNLLEAMLLTDDTSGILADGTPNGKEILQAFRNHGMLPVDVWVRDRPFDRGDVPSNPGDEPFWVSNDILLYTPRGWSDAPSGLVTHVEVLVRNRGYLAVERVTVELYAADPAEGLRWPRDWTLIGTSEVADIRPGHMRSAPRIAWRPRSGGERALMARLICDDDPTTAPDSVPDENNVCQRNVTVEPHLPGDMFERYYRPRLNDRLSRLRRAMEIVRERVPPELDLRIDWVDPRTKRPLPQPPTATVRTARICATQLLAEPPAEAGQQPPASPAPTARTRRAADRAFAELDRTVAKLKTARAPKAKVDAQASRPADLPVKVHSFAFVQAKTAPSALVKLSFRVPRNAKPGEQYIVHAVEREGGKIVTGMTYVIRVKR